MFLWKWVTRFFLLCALALYAEVESTRDVALYTTFRPKYPEELLELFRIKFTPDGSGRLLDLGCGSGQITFLLAPFYKEVEALDIDDHMIQKAIEQAKTKNVTNIAWLHQGAEETSLESEKFDLITIATAFHWMDRPVVLKNAYTLLKEGGGIAIFCAKSWWSSTIAWQQEIIKLIQHYLGTNQPYYPPAFVHNSSHAALLHAAHFENIQSFTVTTPHFWSLKTILGYLYSTAFCNPSRFGKQLEKFEKDVESIFLRHHPSGECKEDFPFHVLIGYKSYPGCL
ncbi:MAG: class I SAM-dependent methyltransferase [Chlamydiota bacterium]